MPTSRFVPLLSELTLLGPPTGAALRRAVVQPALKCGYRFEDEALVEEILSEVEDERGALPMVAFAASRLWEHRDREQGLLTREAYEHIGGVGGALAQHAEATLEKIGNDRIPIVREIFRNLGHCSRNPCRPRHGRAAFRIRRPRSGRRGLACSSSMRVS